MHQTVKIWQDMFNGIWQGRDITWIISPALPFYVNLPHPVENWYLLRLMGRIWNFASRDFLGIKIPPIKSFLNFFQVFLLSLQLEEWVWVSIFSMRIFLSFIAAFTMYIVKATKWQIWQNSCTQIYMGGHQRCLCRKSPAVGEIISWGKPYHT